MPDADEAAVATAPERRERVAPSAGVNATPSDSLVRRIADEVKAMGLDAVARIDRMTKLIGPHLPEVLDTRAVANLIGCCYGEARNRMLDGRIKAVKDRRWLRSRREWVDEYLSRVTVRPTSKEGKLPASPSRRKRAATVPTGNIALEFLRERGKKFKDVPA